MMSDDELDELASDIEANGQVTPAQVYDGKILDGRNRYQALEILNSRLLTADKPAIALTYGVFAKEVNPANDAKALAFVRSHNLSRRNLTTSQRAAIAVELKRHYAEIAKRDVIWRKENQSRVNSHTEVIEEESPFTRRSDYKAAQDTGVGQQSVSRADTIAKSDPALFKEVLEGKTTVNKAYNQIKPKKEPEFVPLEDDDTDPDPIVESSSEEIVNSFVSSLEDLFPDEIQTTLNEIYNRRRDCIVEFLAKLRILEPTLFN